MVNETTRARATGATLDGSSVTLNAVSTSAASAKAKASANGATENQAGSTPNEATDPDPTDSTPTTNANTSDGSVDVAAAIAFTYLSSLVEAFLDGGVVNASGALGVQARGTRSASSSADSSNVSSSGTGVGVAVAVTIMIARTFANLLGTLGITADSVAVTADNPGTDKTEAGALSGQGSTAPGVAGALAVGVTDLETTASLGPAANVSVNGSGVTLTAGSGLTTNVSAAPTPGADPSVDGNVGVGASVAVNVIDHDTVAELADGSALTGAGDLTLTANSTGTHETSATGGAAGGTAVTPVVAITISNASTRASIGAGPRLTLGGDLTMGANQSVSVTTTAKGDAIGVNAAVGASLALAVVNHTVEAVIARDVTASGQVGMDATGHGSSTVTASASASGAPDKNSGSPTPDAQAGSQRDLADNVATSNDANGSEDSPANPPSQTSNGTVAVAAAISINILTTQSLATIESGVVLDASAVSLATAANSDAETSADGSATVERGPPASVGAAIAITVANVTNTSTVAGTVNAPTTMKSLVNTTPDATHTFSSTATSGAGGGDVSVAGSFALAVVTLVTETLVTGTVNGGQLDAEASSSSTTSVTAKPGEKTGAGTKAGVGASIALSIVNDTTRATIAGTPAGTPTVRLLADQAHTVTTTAKTGAAGGGVAVAGAVALAITNLHAYASLAAGAPATLAALDAKATQTVESVVDAAGDATNGSDAAVGVSLALAFADHGATADTARNLSVEGAASFEASSDSTVTTSATASATGAPEDDGSTPSDGVDQQVAAERANADSLAPPGGDSGSEETPSAETSSGGVSVAAAVAITVSTVTVTARLDSGVSITAGGLALTANGRTTATAGADGSSASAAGGTSVAAAVALTVARLVKDASLTGGATMTGAGPAALTAGGSGTNKFGASAKSGAGGGDLGVAGSVAVTVAIVRADATVRAPLAAGGVDVTASASSESTTTTEALPGEDGVSGAKTGVGVSFALSVVDDRVSAGVADGVTITGARDITLHAQAAHDTTTTAKTGAKGKTAVAPAVATTVSNGLPTARIGSGAALAATGDVSVVAEQDAQAKTVAAGDTEGSDTAVGVALAFTYAEHTVVAEIARNLNVAGSHAQSPRSLGRHGRLHRVRRGRPG